MTNQRALLAWSVREPSLLKEASPRKRTLLDCFCGMGGVSDGFAMEDFDVIGIDIVDAPKLLGYKHKFIQADMLTLKGEDFGGFDVVWGSPPCRDFSQLCDKRGTKTAWKIPKDPRRGLILINAFLQFVKQAEPKIWILENASGLAKHLTLKPRALDSKIKGGKRHVFYGNFPNLLIPQTSSIPLAKINCPNRSWERAKIPLPCSQAFAQACKEQLQ